MLRRCKVRGCGLGAQYVGTFCPEHWHKLSWGQKVRVENHYQPGDYRRDPLPEHLAHALRLLNRESELTERCETGSACEPLSRAVRKERCGGLSCL